MAVNSFLNTRVARRILGLFVLTSIVPLGILAALVYRQAATRLRDERTARLQESARTATAATFERLQMVDKGLRQIARGITRDGQEGLPTWLLDAANDSSMFEAVSVVQGDRVTSLLGAPIEKVSLDAGDRAQLDAARPLVVVTTTTGVARVLVARKVRPGDPASPVVWGAPGELALWGFDGGSRDDPELRRLCIFDSRTGSALHCPLPAGVVQAWRYADGVRSMIEWQDGDNLFLGAPRQLFLRFEFGSEPWVVVAGASQAGYFDALSRFRRTFLLVVCITAGVVFWLANVLIRRNMTPLEQLRAGTSRLEAGLFGKRVEVSSGDEFEDLASSFNLMAASLEEQFSTLQAINALDHAALSTPQLAPLTGAVLREARSLFGAAWAAAGTTSGNRLDRWRIASAGGERDSQVEELRLSDTDRARVSGDQVLEPGAGRAAHPLLRGSTRPPSNIRRVHLYLLPLSGGMGLVALGFTAEAGVLSPTAESRLRTLAAQAALGLSSVGLVDELDSLSWGAITALARTIDAKSPWTAGHSERVTRYALEVADRMGISAADRLNLHRGGLLHDIGKIGVSNTIIDKPAKLTDDEMATMREHPAIGARILSPVEAFQSALPIVLHHHEAWNGSGYPHGLAGEDIPPLARVLTVADVFDALTSSRPYRPGWPQHEAVAYIADRGGINFDPAPVSAFLSWIREAGQVVEMDPSPTLQEAV